MCWPHECCWKVDTKFETRMAEDGNAYSWYQFTSWDKFTADHAWKHARLSEEWKDKTKSVIVSVPKLHTMRLSLRLGEGAP